jgi:hypothetical protein
MNLDRSGDRVAEAMRLRIIAALGVAAGWPTLCVLEWVAPLGCNNMVRTLGRAECIWPN